MDERINITPILEHLFGVSQIDNKKDLELLIETLKEMGDADLMDTKTMAEISKRMQEKKQA